LAGLSKQQQEILLSQQKGGKKKKKAEITLAFEVTSFSLAKHHDKFIEIEQDQDFWDKTLP